MHITITAARVNVDSTYDTTTLRVITGLTPHELSKALKRRGIGYLDHLTAHINTVWLRDQNEGPQWQAAIDHLIASAEGRKHFDGLFVEAPLQQVDTSAAIRENVAHLVAPTS